MNGERYPGESLPFEPSMRHADDRLIAIIERATYSCMTGRTKPKCSIFSMQGVAASGQASKLWRIYVLQHCHVERQVGHDRGENSCTLAQRRADC